MAIDWLGFSLKRVFLLLFGAIFVLGVAGGAAFFEYLFYLEDHPYRYYPGAIGGAILLLFSLTVFMFRRAQGAKGVRGKLQGFSLGLDFGNSSVKGVLVKGEKGEAKILAAGSEPLPAGVISDTGLILRPKEAAEATRKLLRRLRASRVRHVVTTVSHGAAVIRLAQFPRMSRDELREALKWEAGQHLPLPPEQAVLDFDILDPADNSAQMTVFLAAAPRPVAEALVQTLRLSGFQPASIKAFDLEANSLARALELLSLLPAGDDMAWAALDLGAKSSKLTIFAGAVPQVTRSLSPGGDGLTELLSRELGLEPKAAEELKRQEGLEEGSRVRAVLWPQLEELFMEVRRSLEYFLIQRRGARLQRVFLLGGGAGLPGLASSLQDYLGATLSNRLGVENGFQVVVPFVPADSLAQKKSPSGKKSGLGPLGAEYFIALGSALRSE